MHLSPVTQIPCGMVFVLQKVSPLCVLPMLQHTHDLSTMASKGQLIKPSSESFFCNQLWKEEVSCAAKHNEASNSPAPRRSTTSEWAPFLMFLLPSSYYNYLFLSKIAPHRGPSTINGQDRESGHSQCESLCNLHSTANRNDKKSGAVSRKLILKKQFFFFRSSKCFLFLHYLIILRAFSFPFFSCNLTEKSEKDYCQTVMLCGTRT